MVKSKIDSTSVQVAKDKICASLRSWGFKFISITGMAEIFLDVTFFLTLN